MAPLTRSTASAARLPVHTPLDTLSLFRHLALDGFSLGAVRKWALDAEEGLIVAIEDLPKGGILVRDFSSPSLLADASLFCPHLMALLFLFYFFFWPSLQFVL
ncbi:hypothetical protein B0H16DRAFT_737002 [Mycena metata]|uniref:Uncharacterized protein n=1 Tax=Mycena metata TaxID=1033252 RepID=A0AAD7J574_9AGAR|nr:hypothetical protein B0H16DRAFT_737002 [Mycena metata]